VVNFNMVRGGAFARTVRRASDNSFVEATSQLAVLIYNASGSFVGSAGLTGHPSLGYTAVIYQQGPITHVLGSRALSAISGIDFIPEMYGGIQCPVALEADCRILQSTPISVTAGATTAASISCWIGRGDRGARAEATPAHGAELFSELPCTSGACHVTVGTAIALTTGTVTPHQLHA
jgi:hypothetical protein